MTTPDRRKLDDLERKRRGGRAKDHDVRDRSNRTDRPHRAEQPRPSEVFDWDLAIVRFRLLMDGLH